MNHDADTRADQTQQRNKEPEERILRSEQQIVLREIDSGFGGVRSPMEIASRDLLGLSRARSCYEESKGRHSKQKKRQRRA